MTRVISVNNNKGGVLKTSTTISIASILAKKYNKKVLIIDTDSQSNVATAFGLNVESAKKSLYDLLVLDDNVFKKDRDQVEELIDEVVINNLFSKVNDFIALKEKEIKKLNNQINFLKSLKRITEKNLKKQEYLSQQISILEKEIEILKLDNTSDYGKISLMPSNSSLIYFEYKLLENQTNDLSNKLKNIIDFIKKYYNYDYILIDTPPTLNIIQNNILMATELAILPLEMEYFAIKGLTKMIDIIYKFKKRNKKLELFAILPTKVTSRARIHKDIYKKLKLSLLSRDDDSADKLIELEKGIPITVQEASSIGYEGKPLMLTKNLDNIKPKDRITNNYVDLVQRIIDYDE